MFRNHRAVVIITHREENVKGFADIFGDIFLNGDFPRYRLLDVLPHRATPR
jgi:hypothetical protein